MKFALLTVLIINYVSFFWSVVGVFRKHNDQDVKKYRFLQFTSISTWIVSLILVYKSEISSAKYLYCIIAQIVCLIGFWYNTSVARQAKFSIVFSNDTPNIFIKSGLYKVVRHPFYMIYLIAYSAVGIIIPNPILLLLILAMYLIYYTAAKLEERKFHNSQFSEEYEVYKRQTGMLFPKISSYFK